MGADHIGCFLRDGRGRPSLVSASESEWVRRAKQGDARAFAELFKHYQHRAFAVAIGILHSEEDALDVVQESFVKAFKHLDSFQGNASFYTWLYRIVTNMAIDLLRRRRKAAQTSFDDAVRQNEEVVGEEANLLPSRLGVDPHRELARQEVIAQVHRALATLSPIHRTVIILREQEGLSYEEMALVMKCSKGTIMSRLHHARKNLQKALEGYLDGSLELE